MAEPTQELKDIVSFAAHDAGWDFHGMKYEGQAPNTNSRTVPCTHGLPLAPPFADSQPYQTTTLELKKVAQTRTRTVTPILVGVCPGGVLHYCDIKTR